MQHKGSGLKYNYTLFIMQTSTRRICPLELSPMKDIYRNLLKYGRGKYFKKK
jgi:hypothetical protein